MEDFPDFLKKNGGRRPRSPMFTGVLPDPGVLPELVDSEVCCGPGSTRRSVVDPEAPGPRAPLGPGPPWAPGPLGPAGPWPSPAGPDFEAGPRPVADKLWCLLGTETQIWDRIFEFVREKVTDSR